MPTGAVWTSAKETAYVDFLVHHVAEAGNGGNFKTATFQQAVSHLAPLIERGTVKTMKTCWNKWTAFCKICCIIHAIQSVSGWRHPKAKPFRNKGWMHFNKVALIMPSTAAGSNIFHPTATSDNTNAPSVLPPPSSPAPPMSSDPQDVKDSDHDKTPPSSSGLRKQARKAATSSHSASKRVRVSQGAMALQSMSHTLAGFNTAFTAALAPQAPAVVPSPVRRTNTVTAAQRLEANWLSLTKLVALIDFLANDRMAAEIYSALTEPNVRKEWVCTQLERLCVIVF
ncbi:hypothetical protein B0H34DRAFT_797371 [Crassisporium funariophilum]|nr:hypothetical protein B0H34DRAFT_797371 [Crassisporium funariophilum]